MMHRYKLQSLYNVNCDVKAYYTVFVGSLKGTVNSYEKTNGFESHSPGVKRADTLGRDTKINYFSPETLTPRTIPQHNNRKIRELSQRAGSVLTLTSQHT